MSTGYAIDVRDGFSPLLQRLRGAAEVNGLSLVMGRALVNVTKDHLIALNAQRHRHGRNFYTQAARATFSRVTPEGPVLGVNQTGFRLRYFGTDGLPGGRLRPKAPRRYLTIPAAPEAYGMRAGMFPDLDFQIVLDPKTQRLRPALVQRVSQAFTVRRRKQKDGSVVRRVVPGELRGGKVMFWLVRSARQAADPSVMPTREVLVQTAVGAAATRIMRLRLRSEGGAS